MNEDEAARLRDRIARDQGWTLCRCGHILDACADCRGWLVEHSPRIAAGWRWFVNHAVFGNYTPARQWQADEAEFCDRVAFGIVP